LTEYHISNIFNQTVDDSREVDMEPIKHELEAKAGPAAAYAALATEKGIRDWWCADSDVGDRVGASSTLRFNKSDMPAPVVMQFKVEALEPDKKVVWACTANDNPAWVGTKLTWEVAPNGKGSAVSITHDGWKQGGPMYDQTVEGWKFFIGSLQSYLDGRAATPM
jgi:uncharacterized protein YndB with AHSA1/START domain